MRNKSLALLLTTAFAAMLLTACTPNDTSSTPSIAETTATSTVVTSEIVTTTVTTSDAPIESSEPDETTVPASTSTFSLNDVPAYNGKPAVVVNGNKPYFDDGMIKLAMKSIVDNTKMFGDDNEQYLPLDELGRCQTATGLLSTETMPPEDEDREGIGMVKPAGWHTVKYPDVIKDLYLYNRCHLIGWQLGNENANEKNLTTGTRYVNVDGMLPYENKTANYMRDTGNHVLYRVTPIFVDDELVCRGILMEAQSIEDDNCVFCVYCYDVQPYIHIDYLTGNSYQVNMEIDNGHATQVSEGDKMPEQDLTVYDQFTKKDYVLNVKTKKIHTPDCGSVEDMNPDNREDVHTTLDELINEGYEPCKNCNPT